MEIPALEEDEPQLDVPRPSRYERIRAAAAARGIPLSAILTFCGVVVLIYLAGKIAYRMLDILLMIAVSGFLSVVLNPLVGYVERAVRRRGWAVAIVVIWATLVFIGLAALFGYPLLNGVTHLAVRLPSYMRDAADGHGWVGQLIRRLRLQQWVAQNSPKLESLGASLARPALSIGKGAASLLGTLLTIFAITTLVLLEGPKIRLGLLGSLPPERAERYSRVAREINESVTGYVVGNLVTSLIAGLVVFVDLAALGLPFPLLWALWVAIVDFLPMVGGALAGIPTVLFALAHSLTAGLVTAAVFVGYQQLENHVLNPLIMSRTVKVSPLLVLMSVLLGTSLGDWAGGVFGGFVAALISIPCAAAIQVIAREIWRNTALLSGAPDFRARRPSAASASGRQRRGVGGVGGVEQDLLQLTGQVAAPGHGGRGGQRGPVKAHPDHVIGGCGPLPRISRLVARGAERTGEHRGQAIGGRRERQRHRHRMAQRRIGELKVRTDRPQHLQPGVVSARAGMARAMHNVHARQPSQADDTAVPALGPGRNPHLGLERAQRHDFERIGQQGRVRRDPAQGRVGAPLADQREPGIHRCLQPGHVDVGQRGNRPEPGRCIRGECIRQLRGQHEPQPWPAQARRLSSPAHPVLNQGQHRP
jgi:predicted PurR-regulated permease PerM